MVMRQTSVESYEIIFVGGWEVNLLLRSANTNRTWDDYRKSVFQLWYMLTDRC
jgi:hypothetical protein